MCPEQGEKTEVPACLQEMSEKEVEFLFHILDAVIHLHGYFPLRFLRDLTGRVIFDITCRFPPHKTHDGTECPYGVNQAAIAEAYLPLLKNELLGLLCDIYPPVLLFIKKYKPDIYNWFRGTFAPHALFASPPTQVILPLVPPEFADLLVKIGLNLNQRLFGLPEQQIGFFLPECSVDLKTLQVLYNNSIRFVILGDNQLDLRDKPRSPVYKVQLDEGNFIYVIPYYRSIHYYLAFINPYGRDFFEMLKKHSFPLVAIDWETFGHHSVEKMAFLKYILSQAARAEMDEIFGGRSLAQARLEQMQELREIPVVKIIESSSWSCPHGLARWKGECNCDGATDAVNTQKNLLYNFFIGELNSVIANLDENHLGWQKNFIDFFTDQVENILGWTDIDYQHVPEQLRPLFQDLIICIFALQSCAYFFSTELERSSLYQIIRYKLSVLQENSDEWKKYNELKEKLIAQGAHFPA